MAVAIANSGCESSSAFMLLPTLSQQVPITEEDKMTPYESDTFFFSEFVPSLPSLPVIFWKIPLLLLTLASVSISLCAQRMCVFVCARVLLIFFLVQCAYIIIVPVFTRNDIDLINTNEGMMEIQATLQY